MNDCHIIIPLCITRIPEWARNSSTAAHLSVGYESAYTLLEVQQISVLAIVVTGETFREAKNLIEYLYSCFYSTRTLIIADSLEATQVIELLSAGADTFVLSTVTSHEITIVIKRLLYMSKLPLYRKYSVQDLTFSPDTGQLTVANTKKQLRKKESQLLHCLFQHKNQLVKRETLVSFAWQESEEHPTRTTLDVYIRKIRMRLGKHSECIRTIRGFGYMLKESTIPQFIQ